MTTDLNLFPTLVQRVNLPPNQAQYDALDDLLAKVLATSSENAWGLETGKSTGEHDLYLFRAPQMRWLMEAMTPHVYAYWKQLDYRRDVKIVPTSGWANLHQHGQVTGEHSHCGGAIKAHVSVAYYFKKPANSGNIEFVDPLEYIHKMSPKHIYDETFGSMYSEVDAGQFDLVIFPSWLKHRTQPNLSNEDRVAISVNFIGLW